MSAEMRVSPESWGVGNERDNAFTSFFRQFGALVRKNFLSKRRSKLQLALELLCPAVVMLLIGTIKTSIVSEVTEAGIPTTDTPVPTYENMQNTPTFPNVLCYDNNMFMRCGCHLSEDVYPAPYSYLTGVGVGSTGATMWAVQHDASSLFMYCSAAVSALTEATSLTFSTSTSQCISTKFALKVCDDRDIGFDVEAMGTDKEGLLDDACGEGTSEMDFTAEDYQSVINDAVDLLDGFVSLSIPEDEIDHHCEVCGP